MTGAIGPDSRSRDERTRRAAIVAACVIWGASFLFGKIALEEVSVAHLVLYRFALTSVILVPLAALRAPLPRRADWLPLTLAGFLGVPAQFLLQFHGLEATTATRAALIVGTAAPLLAIGGYLFRNERIGGAGWAAVAASTAGVVLLVGIPGGGGDMRGDLLVLASMFMAAAYVLACARFMDRMTPLTVTAWSLGLGTVTLLPFAWRDGVPPIDLSAATWSSLAALGLGCTAAAYGLWNWGLARIEAGRAGVYLNLEPLVGALLGILLLGDPLTAGTPAGGALILLGGAWITRPVRRRPLPSAPQRSRPRQPAGRSALKVSQ